MSKLDGLSMPNICLGTSPLGGMPDTYGYDVDEAQAVATIRHALDCGLTFIDTSNEYGDGESERRIGTVLRELGASGQRVVIASKADPVRAQRILDGDRVRESFAESAARLGVDRLDVYYLHDPERFDFADMVKPGSSLDAIRELKAQGLVGLIGVAGGDLGEMRRYLDTGLMDVILNHNHFTLLDRSASPLITDCVSAGVAFVNAAPYASGILAKPLASSPRYGYRAPSPMLVATVEWLHQICGKFGVPLAALALQFSTRDPRIRSTVVGVSAPQRIDELMRNATLSIPPELWELVEDRLAPHTG